MPKKKKKSNNSSFPTMLFVGGGIALIAAAFIFFSQNNNPAPVAEAPIGEGIPYPEIARVSLAESKSALDSGSAILLDVRSAEAFAGQHITGAVNIPVNDLGARLGELDPNAWIIPYCT
jgi:hypothetical protein